MARRGRQRRDLRAERGGHIPILPWRAVENRLPPIEVLSQDQLEAIHHASLRVLAEAGIKVLGGRARAIYRAGGARVDEPGHMVRFDPAMVEEVIRTAPPRFDLHARNPARDLAVGGSRINFACVGGPSFCSDLDRGRRAGTIAEYRDFIRLTQCFDIIHTLSSSPFEPLDLPAETRHLDKALAATTLTDKIWACQMLGGARALDALEMAAIAQGKRAEDVRGQPLIHGNINTNSPRQLDGAMADGLITLAEYGQPVVVTPFTLLGAMAPTTLAGALTQQNAEALAGIVLTQLINPGTPVVYGGFTSNVDMKSGAPAFGTPEYTKACQASGQLTRRYGVPYRSSGTNASNAVDAQAAYESEMSIWGAVTGHANMVFHAAGWLEGGLVGSFEKLVMDAEILQMMACYLDPIAVNAETLAVEAIGQVPPGGHYFGSAHTLERYEDAFYAPLLSDWRNFETWEADGSRNAAERANRIWKQLLRDYEPPTIDPAIAEALEDYVARRKREIAEHGL